MQLLATTLSILVVTFSFVVCARIERAAYLLRREGK
jgi:hypothetical protein